MKVLIYDTVLDISSIAKRYPLRASVHNYVFCTISFWRTIEVPVRL